MQKMHIKYITHTQIYTLFDVVLFIKQHKYNITSIK